MHENDIFTLPRHPCATSKHTKIVPAKIQIHSREICHPPGYMQIINRLIADYRIKFDHAGLYRY